MTSYSHLYRISICLLSLLALCISPSFANEEAQALDSTTNLTGTWKVLLKNSNGYKQLRFVIDEKDGRPRGKMISREIESQELDGRKEEDGTILFWSRFVDSNGWSKDTNFRCHLNNGVLTGKGQFLDKPYELRAERVPTKANP